MREGVVDASARTFQRFFVMCLPHRYAQAHAQKSGEVRERVCSYFEQDHLQGVDTAPPSVETCCKGALWADVLSFTRANYEDVDRFEIFSCNRVLALSLNPLESGKSARRATYCLHSEVSIAKIFLGIPTSKYPKYRY